MSDNPLTLSLPADVADWDHYFLYLALVASIKSKDPKCRVGAVIASRDKVVLSTGFNGFARGVDDDDMLLANVPEKLKMICHAEANAIMNAARVGVALEQSTITSPSFPAFHAAMQLFRLESAVSTRMIIATGLTIQSMENIFESRLCFDRRGFKSMRRSILTFRSQPVWDNRASGLKLFPTGKALAKPT
jgi:hypothetical protein